MAERVGFENYSSKLLKIKGFPRGSKRLTSFPGIPAYSQIPSQLTTTLTGG